MKSVAPIFFIITTCSLVSAGPLGKIIGGHDASEHIHPFMVSLQVRFLWLRAHYCGGSLISENWVLTAGHCTKGSWLLYLLGIEAVAGTMDIDDNGPGVQVIRVDKRIPHPKYEGDIGPHDIGLVRTQYPFWFTQQVQPINLPCAFDIPNEPLTLFGWGVLRTTFFFPDIPSKLQEVQVEYLPFKECYAALDKLLEPDESNPLDNTSNICTGPIDRGIAACNGDSGGPLVQYIPAQMHDFNETYGNITLEDLLKNVGESLEEQDIPVVVGIVSWGVTPCGEEGAPTVYTNVMENKDFILETINMY